MGMRFLGTSVQGASHRRSGLPCQDNFAIRDQSFRYAKATPRNIFYSGMGNDVTLLSVADGHGSSACPYSENGSRLAVNTFCDVMAEFCFKYRQDMESLYHQLKRESEVIHFIQALDIEWKARVLRDYNTNKKKNPPMEADNEPDDQKSAIYRLYGTTLLGMLITERFVFVYQLGDGDINRVERNSVTPMVKQEKILGVETHSMAKIGAWKKAETTIEKRSPADAPYMYMLSTDGMINSFVSEDEFFKNCKGYLELLEKHGPQAVQEKLPAWLTQTSEEGCGDDITVVMAYVES